ncbi:MAG TPA: EthD domain-containing protein, partial [Solirubrobacteraceae bacterium]|nr:EthD domain-containing protein [Solirubrobacteraceae bacterium]
PGRAARRAVACEAIAGAAVPGMELSELRQVWQLWFDELGDAEAALADERWRTALVAGDALALVAREAVQFDRGDGAVKFMALSARSERFATREEWVRYWVDVHGPMAHGIPEFTRHYTRYVHNYVLPSPHATGGLQPAFDGIVEEWLPSVEEFAACLREPRYLELVAPDERLFVDFSRSHVLLVSERTVL